MNCQKVIGCICAVDTWQKDEEPKTEPKKCARIWVWRGGVTRAIKNIFLKLSHDVVSLLFARLVFVHSSYLPFCQRMWICPEPVWVDHVFDRSHQSITIIGLLCDPLLPNERRDSLKGHGWGTIKDRINRTPVQTKLKRHVTSSLCG